MFYYCCNLEKKLKLNHLIVNLYQTDYICTRKKFITDRSKERFSSFAKTSQGKGRDSSSRWLSGG